MNHPKVSVILTSYNHSKYLRESINSVLEQTFTDFELFIVDDASTDNSWEIINSYSDVRVRAFRSKVNTKYGGDLRKAISELATGEYIAIHHSDDVWEPRKIEKQVAFLNAHPETGAVFTQVSIIDENSDTYEDQSHYYYRIFEQHNRSRYEWLNHFFYYGNALCHPSILIRKICYEDCGLYRYGLAQIADFDMWVRLCLKYEIYILPEKLVRFRVLANEMNASGNRPDARIRGEFEFLQMYENYSEIKTPDEFMKVFPTAKKYFTPAGFDLGFALGIVALQPETFHTAKLFGLRLLFEAINDPERAKNIEELYGFGNSEFTALSAKYDIFAIEGRNMLVERDRQIVNLNQVIAERDGQVADLNQVIAERDGQVASLNQVIAERDGRVAALEQNENSLFTTLTEIYSSRSWRLLAPLRWCGRQWQRAIRMIRGLPVMFSRPHSVSGLFRKFVIIWREDGWTAVKLFVVQYLDKLPEANSPPSAVTSALEIKHKPRQRPEILFISHEASRTGAPVFLLDLIRFLSDQLDLDFVILLRTGGELEPEFRKLGTTIALTNPYHLDPLVLSHLKNRNIKLVYSNTITNGVVQKQLKQLGCPILCHVHELAFSIGAFYGDENLKQVLDTTTKFLAGSEAVAGNLREQLHLPKERIALAHPFISTQANLSVLESMALPLNLPQSVVVVGACGTIGWRKGTDLFLQVARLVLAKTNQHVVFVWVGGPLSRGDHINLSYDAKMMGIDKHIIFTGNTTSHLPYFAEFDIFILPSREDPFPLVALDAASLGIPIVCFHRAGGTPELVEEDAGMVVPYLDIGQMAEAVIQLVKDDSLRKQLGKCAQKKVTEHYDISVGGEHIVEIIKTFL